MWHRALWASPHSWCSWHPWLKHNYQKKQWSGERKRNWYSSKEHFMAGSRWCGKNLIRPSATEWNHLWLLLGFDSACYITLEVELLPSCLSVWHVFWNLIPGHTLCVCWCHAAKSTLQFFIDLLSESEQQGHGIIAITCNSSLLKLGL